MIICLYEKLGNRNPLAEAIKSLEMTELRKCRSEKALKWAKKFSWDKSAEEFLRVIKDVS